MTRFLQVSTLALSSVLFDAACSRPETETSVPAEAISPAAVSMESPMRRWEDLIAGHPGLPSRVAVELRAAAREDALAADSATAPREGVAGTVSMARHQRKALRHYEQALALLGEGDYPAVRHRIDARRGLLASSLPSLDQINRRLGLSD